MFPRGNHATAESPYWLDHDNNTKFFHAVIKKFLSALRNDNDEWCYDTDELKSMVQSFYDKLYMEDVNTDITLLPHFPTGLSDVDAEHLSTVVTKEEVRQALFDMSPKKIPRLFLFEGRRPPRKTWEVLGYSLSRLHYQARLSTRLDENPSKGNSLASGNFHSNKKKDLQLR